MKTLLCLCAGLVMALTAVTAHAADVSGKWTAEMTMPDGGNFQLAFTFKQDGAQLTGTVQGPQGDPIEISNGKVDGNEISFEVPVNGTTITHQGTISADGSEIKLTTKSDNPDFPAHDLTLKREKQAPQMAAGLWQGRVRLIALSANVVTRTRGERDLC